jgi:hypothetical protein
MKVYYGSITQDEQQPQQFLIIAEDHQQAQRILDDIGLDLIGELNEVLVYDDHDITYH